MKKLEGEHRKETMQKTQSETLKIETNEKVFKRIRGK